MGRLEEMLDAQSSDEDIEILWSLLGRREKRKFLVKIFLREDKTSVQELKQSLASKYQLPSH